MNTTTKVKFEEKQVIEPVYEYSADVADWKPVPGTAKLLKIVELGFNIRRKKQICLTDGKV